MDVVNRVSDRALQGALVVGAVVGVPLGIYEGNAIEGLKRTTEDWGQAPMDRRIASLAVAFAATSVALVAGFRLPERIGGPLAFGSLGSLLTFAAASGLADDELVSRGRLLWAPRESWMDQRELRSPNQ